MKDQNKAYFFAFGAVLLWSTVATAFKISLNSVGFLTLLFYSSLTATIALGLVLLFEGKFKTLKNISKKSLMLAALRGFLNPFLYYLILLKAYSILPAQEAMSLNYVWPLMLVLLSIPILKQKIKIRGLLGILLSFFGVIFIATHGNISSLKFENSFGAALALSSSVVWALFWIANLKSSEDETMKLFLSFGFGTLFSIILILPNNGFEFPTYSSLASMIYVGLAEMGIAFYLWLNALRFSDRTDKVSKLIYLSPFFSLLIISLVLNEKIGLYTIIGLILIIAGIAISSTKNKKLNIEIH